jgi:hypothetical protein
MKEFLFPLIASREGWAFRQLLKLITVGCASLTTWLASSGVDASTSAAIVAGIGAALSWGAEIGLSKLASKIATPCLALFACLALASCGALPSGERTFLGIDSAGWLNVGKSASVAAVPVALNERAKVSAKNPIKVN